ncbi:MAG: DNA repair protein RecO [Chitinivibrionia bacterium]|nr:DNA repair protein RecO [Chitinivibrionia bacterium]
MLKKDEGAVLRSGKSGTSSRIVTLLGRRSGKIRLLAKGAAKKDSPFRGALEPGAVIEAVYYYKDGRDVYFLKEASLLAPATAGSGTLQSAASLLAALELVDQITYAGNPEPKVSELIESYLEIGESADSLLLFLAFETKLLDALGALPEFGTCSACGREAWGGRYDPVNGISFCASERSAPAETIPLSEPVGRLLRDAAARTFSEFARLSAEEGARKTFGLLLHWTYTYHVQGYRLPNALKLLK